MGRTSKPVSGVRKGSFGGLSWKRSFGLGFYVDCLIDWVFCLLVLVCIKRNVFLADIKSPLIL